MREAIEGVIAELENHRSRYLKLTDECKKDDNQTGASYFRGKALGIRLAVAFIKEVLATEPNTTDQQHAAKPE